MSGSRSLRTTDDETLAARARSDPESFTVLYDRYVELVFSYCLRRLGSREAAEDATSQTFFKALAAMPRYEANTFRSWLFTITRNVVIDAYRVQRIHQTLDAAVGVSDRAPSPEDAALALDTRRDVRELLEILPKDQREVIELRLAELTGIEIAEVLGRSHASVKMLQFRAISRLRKRLGVDISRKESSSVRSISRPE